MKGKRSLSSPGCLSLLIMKDSIVRPGQRATSQKRQFFQQSITRLPQPCAVSGDSLLYLMETCNKNEDYSRNCVSSEELNLFTNDYNEFRRVISQMVCQLEDGLDRVFLVDEGLWSRKLGIVQQITNVFEFRDTSTVVDIGSASDIATALIKNLFPDQKSNFKRMENFAALFPDVNPRWGLIGPMYKLVLYMLKAFPNLAVFGPKFLDLLLEYSNTRDTNERKELLSLLGQYIIIHEDRRYKIFNCIANKLHLILYNDENPMAASNLLNALLLLIQGHQDLLNQPKIREFFDESVFPLIRLSELPLYSKGLTSVIVEILRLMPSLREDFFNQIHKYWPKSNGLNTAHLAHIIGSLVGKTEVDQFLHIFVPLSKLICRIFDDQYSPSVEIILNLLDQYFQRTLLMQHAGVIYTLLAHSIQSFMRSFYNGLLCQKAESFLRRVTEYIIESTSSQIMNIEPPCESKLDSGTQQSDTWKMVAEQASSHY